MLDSPKHGDSTVVEYPPIIELPRMVSSGSGGKVKGNELTERQSEALNVIRRHIKRRGVPPSRSELASELGLTNPSAVDGHLNALAKKGWVELLPSVERGIRLLREGAPILNPEQLPAVTAGNPIVAEYSQEPKRLNDFDSFSNQFESRPDYFVRVQGDSMDKVGFKTGDVVAVRRHPVPQDGDVVVARIGDEITLKRYRRTGKCTIELQPESNNPEHNAIVIDPLTEDFEIVGIVVGAIIGTRRQQSE